MRVLNQWSAVSGVDDEKLRLGVKIPSKREVWGRE